MIYISLYFFTTFKLLTHLRPRFNFLTDVASIYPHNFASHDAIYFVKFTSPSCSKAPPQHDAATPMLHRWDGVLRLASLSLINIK